MRIAIFHNRYKRPGGEDAMVEFEARLLEQAGHEVHCITVSNNDAFGPRQPAQLKGAALTAARVGWNQTAMRAVSRELESFRPDIGHVHNWFPMLSPSVYEAHRRAGVPVVQTLHNYRLFCASGTCWDGQDVCTACLDGKRARAIKRGCYRGSRLQSAAWWHVMNKGWSSGVFEDLVDAYLAPSEVVRDMHARAGLPAEKIHVVSNACEDPSFKPFRTGPMEAIFIGRLEEEKGIRLLLEAWQSLPWTLHVVGQGSLGPSLIRTYGFNPRIRFHGQLPREEVLGLIERSCVAVFPSLWHEPFGLGVIEAMACGRPVITVGPGAPGTLIEPGVSGLHLPQADPLGLAQAVLDLLAVPSRVVWMGDQARARYLQRFSPKAHLRELMQVFTSLTKSEIGRCA